MDDDKNVSRQLKKEALIALLSMARGNVTTACREAHIPRASYYEWVKDDEKFKRKVFEIKEEITDGVEEKLYNQIDLGNITGIIFYLKTRAKDRGYIEKEKERENAHEAVNTALTTRLLDQLTASQDY